MIINENLVKNFGSRIAVNMLSFQVAEGEIFGLLGPNGAGKTTTIKMLSMLLRPTAGEIAIGGFNLKHNEQEIKTMIGVVPQHFNLDYDLTVWENLILHGKLHKMEASYIKQRSTELLEYVELLDRKDDFVQKLSGGMKRRVGIAQALLNEPKVLILDEPTSGLDPGERMRFRNLLSEFGRNRIVLISTHIVSDVEYIATCNAVMKNGKIAAVGETEELVKEVEGKVWNVVLDMAEVMTYETKIPVVNIYNREDGKTVLRYLAERPVIPGSEPADARMEDLYLWMFPEQGREEVR